MKKLLLLLTLFAFAVGPVLAQDDDLPPPTSKPKAESPKDETKPEEKPNDFKGFQKPKKVDLSKFIIEPNFNFNIAQGRIDVGLSPYVGYQIFSPKNAKDPANGLYAGGGITYFYTGFTGLEVVNPQGVQIGTVKANFHTYGGGAFLQYNVWRGFFARTKLEILHRTMDDVNQAPIPKNPNNYADGFYFPKIEKTIPALLLGAGYNLTRSKNFFFPVMISYDLLHSVVNKSYSLYPNGWVIQLGFVNVF